MHERIALTVNLLQVRRGGLLLLLLRTSIWSSDGRVQNCIPRIGKPANLKVQMTCVDLHQNWRQRPRRPVVIEESLRLSPAARPGRADLSQALPPAEFRIRAGF